MLSYISPRVSFHTSSMITGEDMSVTDFYLTLSSTSSVEHFPQNTLSNFSTKLPKEIHLPGKWRVGISDLIFPSRFLLNPLHFVIVNVYERPNDPISYSTELRSFETNEDFIAHLNDLLSKTDNKRNVSFSINGQGYATVRLKAGFQIMLMGHLCHILGFREDTAPAGKVIYNDRTRKTYITTADARCLLPLHPLVFVHSDIVESSVVGDRLERLLDIVPVEDRHGERIFVHRVEKPRYVPLQRKTLSTLKVELKTDVGDHLPLLEAGEGSTILKLHFKRV